jgi:thioredoxin 2
MTATTVSSVTIPCPHCHALNRVPTERRAEGGKCGKCGKPLFTGHPINLDRVHFAPARRRGRSAAAGGFLGRMVRPLPIHGAFV